MDFMDFMDFMDLVDLVDLVDEWTSGRGDGVDLGRSQVGIRV